MPRPLEPNQPFAVVLAHDRDKPEGERPTFWFRAASAREFRQARAAIRAGESNEVDAVFAFLEARLVNWEHLVDGNAQPPAEVPFDPAELDRVIDSREAFQLFWAYELEPEDKKKSASRP